jgi:hypothetical protein
MTLKEKAKELVDKFWYVKPEESCDGMEYQMAQQCALIAVNELIKETGSKYWYDFKQEIEKL